MVRLLRLSILLAFFPSAMSAFAAGGACPSASTYGPYQNQTLSSVFGITSCYYVAANGSDSNAGTSESAPWLHVPGMPNCTGVCAAVNNSGVVTPGLGFVFRGGDTWHFGNSGASPYTGGTWSMSWGGYQTCNYAQANTGCIYFGVDRTWYAGSSWARPILNGDNPTSCVISAGSFCLASASFVTSCAYRTGTANQLVNLGPGTVFDGFEVTGFCTSDASPSNAQDTYLVYGGTGNSGTGTAFIENSYFHGWTATAGAGSGSSSLACVVIGGSNNGLQVIDHNVIDGSDSIAGECAWGAFPSFYHVKDNVIRYTTQGVGQWCHDIHDNIFEYFDNPYQPTHGNILECNADSNGTAAYQPQNTPNVFYNNIVRHATTAFSSGGQVTLWFCPNASPAEYWFNNILYDLGNSNYWDVAGPPQYSCSNSGGQYMFNNTLVDGRQPCTGTVNSAGGQYLYVYNEHLINSPFATGTYSNCNGASDSSNIAMSDATAVTQGYATTSGAINLQNGGSVTCANENTFPPGPCGSTGGTGSTANAGKNEQVSYCNTLASYTGEPAIGTDAANACRYESSDGCSYNATTHAVTCQATNPVPRPMTSSWDSGAHQHPTSSTTPGTPTNLNTGVN